MNKRKDSSAPTGSAEEAPVQAARTRAKRRLIGAAVLLGIGVIGFPLLFETQPRPIAVDIPIEIPAKDAVAPLTPPPAPPAAPSAPVEAAQRTAAASAPEVSAPPPADPVPASAPRPALAESATAEPAARADAAEARQRDARRAQDLLDGKTPVASEPKPARFVVQAGAYTDGTTLREARQKVERLGLKTYTQVVQTDGGSRTRVRVGPFPTREEAEKASARIKSAGLPASILSL